MNQRPLRPCKKTGCPNLTRDKLGYCEEHKHISKEIKAKRDKYYNKHIRTKEDKRYTQFYNSIAWKKVRESALRIYHGIDIYDYYTNNKITLATTVHHIEELKDNWDKRADLNNLFPVSEANHNVIHALYKKDKLGTQELLKSMLERFREEFNIPPYL